MFPSLILILRILVAWAVALVLAGFVWSGLFYGMERPPGWFFGLLAMGAMVAALLGALTHLRRVRLIAGRLDGATLTSRQQRRIEVPLDRLAEVVARRTEVVAAVHAAGYRYVTLDLEGLRSGNLNQALADHAG